MLCAAPLWIISLFRAVLTLDQCRQLVIHFIYSEPVAQRIERFATDEEAGSSNLSRLAKIIQKLVEITPLPVFVFGWGIISYAYKTRLLPVPL